MEFHEALKETKSERMGTKHSNEVEGKGELNSDDNNRSFYQSFSASPERSSVMLAEETEKRDGSSIPHPDVKYCSICLIDHPVNEMYPINCCSQHSFCIESLVQCVKIATTGSANTAPQIPTCPLANLKKKGCKYVLQQQECEQIIELSLNNSIITWVECEKILKKTETLYLVRCLCFKSSLSSNISLATGLFRNELRSLSCFSISP
jgi:hypothetical protein